MTVMCFSMVGCALTSINEEPATDSADSSGISSIAYNKVNTQDEIFTALLDTMQSNEKKCYFSVSSQDFINADSWPLYLAIPTPQSCISFPVITESERLKQMFIAAIINAMNNKPLCFFK